MWTSFGLTIAACLAKGVRRLPALVAVCDEDIFLGEPKTTCTHYIMIYGEVKAFADLILVKNQHCHHVYILLMVDTTSTAAVEGYIHTHTYTKNNAIDFPCLRGSYIFSRHVYVCIAILYGFMCTHTRAHISLSRTRRSIKVQFSSLIITHTSATSLRRRALVFIYRVTTTRIQQTLLFTHQPFSSSATDLFWTLCAY